MAARSQALLRVAMLVPALANKGPVVVARDIAAGLTVEGHEVVVYYLDAIEELEFPCRTVKLTFRTIFELRDFDIVHTHSLRPDLVGWMLKNVARIQTKFVSTIHNYVDHDLSLAYGTLIGTLASIVWKMTWRGLDSVAVLSQHAQGHYRGFRIRGQVVYNSRPPHSHSGISEEDHRVIAALRKHCHVIGANAAVLRRKGLHQVLYAIAGLPSFGFLLIGDGPELPRLKDLAHSLGVGDRFLTLGYRANAQDYLSCMDVFVMPSYSEGMPLAMLEAAASGVAIVCSDIPLFRELFTEAEVGFFELDNAVSLRETLVRVWGHAPHLAASAQRKSAESYSYSNMVRGYIQFYKDALGREVQQ